MARGRNLIGQKFSKLTVIKDSGQRNKSRSVIWECQCDCGNIAYVDTQSLTRTDGKNTKSCGCLQQGPNLTNQIFGKLTVKQQSGADNHGHKKWLCQCECGNTISVISYDLIRKDGKEIKSCGCSRLKDEKGQRYGKLLVLEKDNELTKAKNHGVYWKCQCDCGNIVSVLGANLRNGDSSSCGCIKSKGEQKITTILNQYNINYIPQYKFNDLKSNRGGYLYFDFAILNKNKNLIALIEYQGSQHYEKGFNKTEKEFQEALERDNMKRVYCKKNNIPLIEIPYTDLDKIDILYLLTKMENTVNEQF